jgi:HEAT repeat protein
MESISMNEDRFEEALADVAAGRGPHSPHLPALSHLEVDQLARFGEAWTGLVEKQKLALVEALSREETDTLRLEFNPIYHLGMDDDSAAVRRCSIEATVEDDSPWLLEHLLALVAQDDEPEVRSAAARALEPFARRAELGELKADEAERVRQTLVETIHRPGERADVRAAALSAVGYFSGELIRRELEAGFRDEALRLDALRGMGHSADPAWLDTILGSFDDPDDTLRIAAASAAGEVGEPEAVPDLVNLIDDPSMPVRLAAIAALGEIGGEEAREALIYALEDKRASVREAAEAALAELEFFEDPLGT